MQSTVDRLHGHTQEFTDFLRVHFAEVVERHDRAFALRQSGEKFFDDFTAAFRGFRLAMLRYITDIGEFLYFFCRCPIQRLHRGFLLPDPIQAKSICNDIEPPPKLVGILEC